jgi:hypothetical protein
MNLSLIFMGIGLMAIGFIFAVVTFGFGIICSWPLLLIGFILVLIGIISPYRISYKQSSKAYSSTGQEIKRICPNCGKTMPMNTKYCPHCGNENKYS